MTFPAGVDAAALARIWRARRRVHVNAPMTSAISPDAPQRMSAAATESFHGAEITVCREGAEPQASHGEHGHDRRGANAEQESAETALRRNVQEIGQISDHVR